MKITSAYPKSKMKKIYEKNLYYLNKPVNIKLSRLLKDIGWTDSTSEAMRLIKAGAIEYGTHPYYRKQIKDDVSISKHMYDSSIFISRKKNYQYEYIQFINKPDLFDTIKQTLINLCFGAL
jgi:ribosome-associated protein YbcJ (S4-like RNA binding protein)